MKPNAEVRYTDEKGRLTPAGIHLIEDIERRLVIVEAAITSLDARVTALEP